ncbi:L-aspartate oxidase [Paramaledivibacter caminithermalis]|jgi:L-aspartate oxidase|uniref:L-aspartate oxidase n=1 Tax=Paramaledivibacter caminithermalis (strain DSM 15212 / CIP 107654 / DViRD3) TaxID=1121301 RepID=A0A1M6S0C4_PARC5|nr:L-aspartate oxidase [Paramaledivibacter caminithermalis]SHK38019.1 L-aspartate oxidase [Paramaledivibacter caminithermalis DSM 15212]
MINRYLIDFNLDKIIKRCCDVVIIGSGIAGLYTALNINKDYKVIVLSKDEIEENNSSLAQGGIAACISDEDDIELHMEDTLKAGSYYNDKEAVRILVSEAKENIENLVKLGVVFDRDEKGNLMVTREGGHSKRRIIHSKDQTGKEIIRALKKAVENRDNIQLIKEAFAIDILTDRKKASGILVKNNNEVYAILAKSIVLATGGIGQIYKNTTNSLIATGDGIAMAYRAGVNIVDMEFVQFHPTAFYSKKDRKRFLISEAVRGEGAVLRNSTGEAFMKNYHEYKDLAPRHIVAKAILTEMKKEEKPNVYLDITHKDEEFIKNRFPYIYSECLKRGIDITKEYIPVCPVQHYIMGGIEIDYTGRTNIDNLYACGEAASVGVHGANRLASNSLLDGIVFGNRVAKDINNNRRNIYDFELKYSYNKEEKKLDLKEIKEKIREVMNKYVFIFRNEEGLNKALIIIKEIIEELNRYRKDSVEYYECVNIATVAYLIIISALKRKKSLGSHIVSHSMEVGTFV